MGKGWPPAEKGVRHEAAGQAVWNSDEVIVVMKRANKIAESVAESVERRAPAERSHGMAMPWRGRRASRNWTLATCGAWGTWCGKHNWHVHRLDGSGRLDAAIQASFPCSTQCRSRMRQLRTSGSVRGAPGDRRPYRDLKPNYRAATG